MSRPVLSVRADGVVCFGDVQLWGWGFWGALKSTALFWVALMWGHTKRNDHDDATSSEARYYSNTHN